MDTIHMVLQIKRLGAFFSTSKSPPFKRSLQSSDKYVVLPRASRSQLMSSRYSTVSAFGFSACLESSVCLQLLAPAVLDFAGDECVLANRLSLPAKVVLGVTGLNF